jgi:tetratricopeptide (TPR) repeat protein/two-component sensor histidine kinase
MKFLAAILFTPFALSFSPAISQSVNLDSLLGIWNDETMPDSTRLFVIHDIIWDGYMFSQPDSAAYFAQLQYDFAKSKGHKKEMSGAMNSIGVSYAIRDDADRAIEYFTNCLEIKREIGDKKGVSASLGNIGLIYKGKGDYENAIDYSRQSLEIDEERGDLIGIGSSLNNLGIIYFETGDYSRSVEYHSRSLKIHEELDDKDGISAALINIGNMYDLQGEPAIALKNYERALLLLEDIGQVAGMADCLNNIGGIFIDQNELEKAKEYYRQGLIIREKVNDPSGAATSLMSIGSVHQELQNYDSALVYNFESLSINEALENRFGIAGSLNNISNIFRLKKDYQNGVKYGKRAIAVSQDLGSLKRIQNAAYALYHGYKGIGDKGNALEMYELFVSTRDSLNSEENERAGVRNEYQYTDKKEALADSLLFAANMTEQKNLTEIEQLRADKNRNVIFGTSAGGFLILVGVMGYFFLDRKRKQERFEKDVASVETQALRSQMNPHFIFNALNSINNFIQIDDAYKASSFLVKFSRVIRQVLDNSREAEVPLESDLEVLSGYLALEQIRMNDKFDFDIQVASDIDPEEVMVPPLVIQPFIENDIWHGISAKEGKGKIILKVEKRDDQLVMIVEDDGVGLKHKKEPASNQPVKKTSLGTKITKMRLDLVQKIYGGKAGFRYVDIARGTRVELDLPLMFA